MAKAMPTSSEAAQAATPTATPTSYKAAHAVFATNELLCGIALFLPAGDIVVATGVCRVWHKALTEDINVQEAMFVAPNTTYPPPPEVWRGRADPRQHIQNLHPSLNRICGRIYHADDSDHNSHPDYSPLGLLKFTEFDHPGGNWREMFVSQPPCTSINVHLVMVGPADHYVDHVWNLGVTFHCKSGIKMGDLHDFIRSKTPRASLRLNDLAYRAKEKSLVPSDELFIAFRDDPAIHRSVASQMWWFNRSSLRSFGDRGWAADMWWAINAMETALHRVWPDDDET